MVSEWGFICNTFRHLASLVAIGSPGTRWICDGVCRSLWSRRRVAVGENRFSHDAIAVSDGPLFLSIAPSGARAQGACMPEIHCNHEHRSAAESASLTVVATFSIGATTPR